VAVSIVGSGSLSGVDSDAYADSLRVNIVPRAGGYSVSSVTGTIGAALAANASTFAMHLDPSAPVRAYIERMRIQYTTIVAYTTPITASRRLALFRGSGAATAGGTAIATVAKKHSVLSGSEFEAAQGGDIRIATTSALTVTGITFETDPIRTMSLVHAGAAGSFVEQMWELNAGECHPVVLEPGQLIAIRNPVAMDAAGTWQLCVNVDWYEAAAF